MWRSKTARSQLSPAPPGGTALGRYTVVWVKRNGKWLIDAVREAAVADPSLRGRLEELSWMIGEWVEDGDAAAIQAACVWSPDKHFLLRESRIQPRGRDPHVVTQCIGWGSCRRPNSLVGFRLRRRLRRKRLDPRGGALDREFHRCTSWREAETAGTTVYTRVDDNTLLVESLGFQVDGESMPDLRVKLVRKPAAHDAPPEGQPGGPPRF